MWARKRRAYPRGRPRAAAGVPGHVGSTRAGVPAERCALVEQATAADGAVGRWLIARRRRTRRNARASFHARRG
eukprot:9414436-Pyramimonas_sp.AAC.1